MEGKAMQNKKAIQQERCQENTENKHKKRAKNSRSSDNTVKYAKMES